MEGSRGPYPLGVIAATSCCGLWGFPHQDRRPRRGIQVTSAGSSIPLHWAETQQIQGVNGLVGWWNQAKMLEPLVSVELRLSRKERKVQALHLLARSEALVSTGLGRPLRGGLTTGPDRPRSVRRNYSEHGASL